VRALIVQPDPTETPGLVGRALGRRGFALDTFVIQDDPDRPAGRVEHPDPSRYDLIVVMGSPWSVFDEAVSDWVTPLLGMLTTAVDQGRAVLGICFGGQALAAALGGSVTRAEGVEFGWHRVHSDIDEVAGVWFQWHHDIVTVPPCATRVAWNTFGPQAFVAGRAAGVQFHPEVDAALLESWLVGGVDDEVAAAGGSADAVVAHARTHPHRTEGLVDWFLGTVAGSLRPAAG